MKAAEAYVGIDPGKNGAIAVLTSGGSRFWLFADAANEDEMILDALEGIQILHPDAEALIEIQNARAGRLACFSLGGSYRACKMALVATDMSFMCEWPRAWRKELGLGEESTYHQRKKANFELAKKLFPDIGVHKDAADALLIAECARRRFEENG